MPPFPFAHRYSHLSTGTTREECRAMASFQSALQQFFRDNSTSQFNQHIIFIIVEYCFFQVPFIPIHVPLRTFKDSVEPYLRHYAKQGLTPAEDSTFQVEYLDTLLAAGRINSFEGRTPFFRLSRLSETLCTIDKSRIKTQFPVVV